MDARLSIGGMPPPPQKRIYVREVDAEKRTPTERQRLFVARLSQANSIHCTLGCCCGRALPLRLQSLMNLEDSSGLEEINLGTVPGTFQGRFFCETS